MIRLTHRKRCAGVTYLELMIVLFILVTLMGISPSFRNMYRKNGLNMGVKELASLIRYARGEAIFLNHEVEIRFDINRNRYRYHPKIKEKEDYRSRREGPKSEFEQIRYLPDGINFIEVSSDAEPIEGGHDTYARILFYPDGTATWAIVTLKGLSSRVMTIEVSPATGLPVIEYVGETKKNGRGV